jgi:thymidylate synthase
MKHEHSEEFGHQIFAATIGEMWAGLVKATLKHGATSYDERRERIALSNIRVKSATQNYPDPIIERHSDPDQLKAMLDFMFSRDVMEDIDVVHSFSPGAKSYRQRIKDGKMIDFVVERLSLIPESKKAVMVFPTYDDYAAVMRNHQDDYLPCLVSIQLRLIPEGAGFVQNTTFYSRSMDVWQKGHGNFLSMAMLSDHIRKEIGARIGKTIRLGPLDGMICDGHIYNEKYAEAEEHMARLKSRVLQPS